MGNADSSGMFPFTFDPFFLLPAWNMDVMANIPQPSRNYKVEVSTGEAEQKEVRHTPGIAEVLRLCGLLLSGLRVT